MNRTKLFLENFLVYGLGSIISKIIPLIMLPIITRLMPSTFYYGLNDMSSIVTSFGTSFAIMGMYDAMFRMFFEKDDLDYKKEVCSNAFYFVLASGLLIASVLILFQDFFGNLFFKSSSYNELLVLSAISILVGTVSSIIVAPTRMLNKRKIFLVTNTLSPIIAYCVLIPMLLHKMYITALPLAGAISSILMLAVFYRLNTDWFSFKRINVGFIWQLLKLGLPMMPTFVIYWVFNSADRLFIQNLLGTADVGIYGVGARVASISLFIYTAFVGGWQYFAFSTMNSEDQVEMTSKVLEYLGALSLMAMLVITPFSDRIFKLLFNGDYVKGAIVFPYLFACPLLLMLFQTASSQFLVIKQTWPIPLILSLGAAVNVGLNACLIPRMGIEGSALSTLLGYLFTIVTCLMVLRKRKLIVITRRFLYDAGLFLVFFVLWKAVFHKSFVPSLAAGGLLLVVVTGMYGTEARLVIHKIVQVYGNVRRRNKDGAAQSGGEDLEAAATENEKSRNEEREREMERKMEMERIHPTAVLGNDVIIKEGTIIGENVVIEEGVFIDYGCIIRDNVHIKKGSFIGAKSILGEYLFDFYKDRTNKKHPLIIGENAIIRTENVIYGDTVIGDNFQSGHKVTIREKAKIGSHVRVGTLSDIQGDCQIGNYVSIHSNVHMGQKSTVKDYVWIFPYVIFTNDPTPPSETTLGVTVDSFAIVAAGSILLPGVHVHQDGFVAAGSVVGIDVPEETIVKGNPARVICPVTKMKNKLTGEPIYPWRTTFSRGMPWADKGYDAWYNELSIEE